MHMFQVSCFKFHVHVSGFIFGADSIIPVFVEN